MVIERGLYGQQRGLGSRPAIFIIDCQYNYIGDDAPITEQQATWPAGGGAAAWKAIRQISDLLVSARAKQIPVLYSRNVQRRTVQFDAFQYKAGWDHRRTLEGDPGTEIVAAIAPAPNDLVIDKSYASVFWGTPLATYLVMMGIDSVIFAGVSTSGCVRASLVDAVMHGYKTAVVSDGTADRIKASHKVALLDIWMKYGDVLTAAEVETYFSGLPASDRPITSDASSH